MSNSTTSAPVNWDATIQRTTDSDANFIVSSGNGSLVRIHPLELENKLVRIKQSVTQIGRDAACDIFCDDSSVSRSHARLHRTEAGFEIEDCRSTNGTFVDGQRVTQAMLTNGCQIQVGNHIFKFLAGDSIESQYHETVYSMMTKDGLTNVFNKRYLVDVIAREFERSRTHKRPFSLVMMDIDFFKKFNDTYGHLAGDEVLQEFARRIAAECTTDQIFGRFGGEEFTLLMFETEKSKAAEFAELIRQKICESPFECSAGHLDVAASFGVAGLDAKKHAVYTDILEDADQQLYLAKENGRNQVYCS